jgi:hypothetical protein
MFVAVTGLLFVGVWHFLTKPETRSGVWQQLQTNPVQLILMFFYAVCGLMFFWGVVLASLGWSPSVPLFGQIFQLWQLGGIGFGLISLYVMATSGDKT